MPEPQDKWWLDPQQSFAVHTPNGTQAPSGNVFKRILHSAASYADRAETTAGQTFLHDINPVNIGHGMADTVKGLFNHPLDTIGNITGVGPAIAGAKQIIANPSSLRRPISPEDLGTTLGGGGAMAAQMMAGDVAGQPDLASKLQESAGKSYTAALGSMEPHEVRSGQRAGKLLAEGPTPIAATRTGLLSQVQEGANQTGPAVTNAIATGHPLPSQPLIDYLKRYQHDKYTGEIPGEVGKRAITNDLGYNEINKVIEKVANASGEGSRVSQDYLYKLQKDLGENLYTPEGQKALEIKKDTATRMTQDHERMVNEYLKQNNPDFEEMSRMHEVYAKSRTLLQKNVLQEASKASKGSAFSRFDVTKPLEMPDGIRQQLASVPWNTVSGYTKAAVAKAISTSNWATTQKILQFAKLGVPLEGNLSTKPVEAGGTRAQ